MDKPPYGWPPLALYIPIGPLLVCVVKLLNCVWFKPVFIAMPGMILISSAASRPWIANSGSIVLVMVVRLSLVVSGTNSVSAATSTVSVLGPSFKAILGRVRFSAWLKVIPFASQPEKPCAFTVTV